MNKWISSVLILSLCASPSWAILGVADIVEDPLNLVQNTATAIRTLQSNVNEVTQINNQIQSLANEARNLVALPLSTINQIQSSFNNYYSLLQQGRGLAFSIQASAQQFESLFSTGGISGPQAALTKLQALLGQVRDAGRIAAQAQAIYDRLCLQQAETTQLLAASQASVGQLQATQASNQLLGVLTDQQASLQQIYAASMRLQLSVYMQDVVKQEMSQQNMQNWLSSWPTATFKGVGEGQGQKFPE